MSKYLDGTGLGILWQKIKDTFVAKESGKGLSSNDLTDSLKSGYDTAASQTHTHSNKALLDTYTQTEANLADAVGKKHEHSNKAELDLIASGDKAKWDAAATTGLAGKVDKEEGKSLIDSNLSSVFNYDATNGKLTIDADVILNDNTLGEIDELAVNEFSAGGVSTFNSDSNFNGNVSIGEIENVEEAINSKVDAVSGKGLSTNDYTTAEKTKLAAFGEASTYALKSDITNVYKYKGSVATISDLPTENLTAGDVYNVEERGINYAWTGTVWDALGELFSIASITNDEINALS